MKHSWLLCCIAISSSLFSIDQLPLSDYEEQEELECCLDEPGRAHHCHNPACPHYQKENDTQKPNQRELQQLAINTLANMAQGLVAIGWNPNNSTNVANNVTNIIGTFANFVAHAINDKTININDIQDLFTDEEFLETCKEILVNNMDIMRKGYHIKLARLFINN